MDASGSHEWQELYYMADLLFLDIFGWLLECVFAHLLALLVGEWVDCLLVASVAWLVVGSASPSFWRV